jgi:hypothetical protein
MILNCEGVNSSLFGMSWSKVQQKLATVDCDGITKVWKVNSVF